VTLLIFGLLGLLYGVILQRSGFCFARAGFELFLLRSRDAVNGVLAGLIVATIGFSLVTAVRARLGLPVADHLLLLPFGPGTLVGATMFGFGMSLAGMCVVGSLFRLGEGYLAGGLALLGMVIGAALDPFRAVLAAGPSARYLLGTPLPAVTLAAAIGLPAAALATVLLLALIWWIARRPPGPAHLPRASWRRRVALTPTVIGGATLALLSTAQMALHSPWTIAYPLGIVASAASGGAGFSRQHGALPLILLDLGIVLGAAASALLGRNLRLRWPRQRRQVAMSLAGGVLMAWGVQLSKGCNIGGLFSALPSLSLSAWLFLPGLLLGSWLGSHIVRRVC